MHVRLNDETKVMVTIEKGLFNLGKKEKKDIIKYRVELLVQEDGVQLIKTNYGNEMDTQSVHIRYDQMNWIVYKEDDLRIRYTNAMNESDDFEVNLKAEAAIDSLHKRMDHLTWEVLSDLDLIKQAQREQLRHVAAAVPVPTDSTPGRSDAGAS